MNNRKLSVVSAMITMFIGLRSSSAQEQPAAPSPGEKAAAPVVLNHDDFREPGRFGLIGAITDDAFQFGGIRADEHYEAVLTLDGSFAALGGSSAIKRGLGDMGVTLRGGPRFSLGHLNYLSLGAQGHTHFFGKDDGVSTLGGYTVGPYVGMSRNFAGTPLMITLWVLPYEFSRELMNDGAGNQVSLEEHKFFQAGGFGLAYLL